MFIQGLLITYDKLYDNKVITLNNFVKTLTFYSFFDL